MNFAKLANLQHSIAVDVWPNGAILSCHKCRFAERITTEQAGAYLKSGWPKHCGATMSCDAAPQEDVKPMTADDSILDSASPQSGTAEGEPSASAPDMYDGQPASDSAGLAAEPDFESLVALLIQARMGKAMAVAAHNLNEGISSLRSRLAGVTRESETRRLSAETWHDSYLDANAENKNLRSALSRAMKDTERLNWLNGRISWFIQHYGFNPAYANIREAIDASLPSSTASPGDPEE